MDYKTLQKAKQSVLWATIRIDVYTAVNPKIERILQVIP